MGVVMNAVVEVLGIGAAARATEAVAVKALQSEAQQKQDTKDKHSPCLKRQRLDPRRKANRWLGKVGHA